MKLDYLKDKKELLSVALFGISVVFGILILVKVTGFFAASAKAESVIKEAVAQNKKLDVKDIEKSSVGAAAVAGELKKSNLFVPPAPKQNPVRDVFGIMGDEALIGESWHKVGDRIGDAKIVAIEPAQVRIEWDGREHVFAPIGSSVPGGPGGPGRGRPDMKDVVAKGPEGSPPVVNINISAPGAGGFGEFSPERMREGFESMRARFENMSEEERQAFRDRMRGQRGGGPGGGPGGGRRRGGD
jgi:hypothetical protein